MFFCSSVVLKPFGIEGRILLLSSVISLITVLQPLSVCVLASYEDTVTCVQLRTIVNIMAAVGIFLDLTGDGEEEVVVLAEAVLAKVSSPAKHISMDWICSCNFLNTLSSNSDFCEVSESQSLQMQARFNLFCSAVI